MPKFINGKKNQDSASESGEVLLMAGVGTSMYMHLTCPGGFKQPIIMQFACPQFIPDAGILHLLAGK